MCCYACLSDESVFTRLTCAVIVYHNGSSKLTVISTCSTWFLDGNKSTW